MTLVKLVTCKIQVWKQKKSVVYFFFISVSYTSYGIKLLLCHKIEFFTLNVTDDTEDLSVQHIH